MPLIKRRKSHDQFSTPSPHKLFVDYPYPIITELATTYQPRKKSNHSHALTSLQWYTDHIHKLFDQSFRQTHINQHSSKAIVNDLRKTTGVKQVLASPMNSPLSDQKDAN